MCGLGISSQRLKQYGNIQEARTFSCFLLQMMVMYCAVPWQIATTQQDKLRPHPPTSFRGREQKNYLEDRIAVLCCKNLESLCFKNKIRSDSSKSKCNCASVCNGYYLTWQNKRKTPPGPHSDTMGPHCHSLQSARYIQTVSVCASTRIVTTRRRRRHRKRIGR